LEFESEMTTSPLTDAEALAYLGDLLYHTDRNNDAIAKLNEAIALDPEHSMANSSLGLVMMKEKKFPEAKQYLAKAVAGNSNNYLAHYYYAYVLSREGMSEFQTVDSYSPENVKLMRNELNRAIELKPDFAESYHLLAFINMITNEQLDESIKLIQK